MSGFIKSETASATPDSAIRTPEEIGKSTRIKIFNNVEGKFCPNSVRKLCDEYIADAIRAERATQPVPSKSFEEFQKQNEPFATESETKWAFVIWQAATEAVRARVIAALPSEEIIQESRIAHKTNAKFWNDDIAFAAACYWLRDRIGVGAKGEGT